MTQGAILGPALAAGKLRLLWRHPFSSRDLLAARSRYFVDGVSVQLDLMQRFELLLCETYAARDQFLLAVLQERQMAVARERAGSR